MSTTAIKAMNKAVSSTVIERGWVCLLVCLCALVGGCGETASGDGAVGGDGRAADGKDGGQVVVFAAASTARAVSVLAERYESETGVRVVVQAASSSVLARQLMQGAEADVVLLAHRAWMDRLDEAGMLEAGTRRDLLANRLVWVIPAGGRWPGVIDRMRGPSGAAGMRIAMGDPSHVPVGMYGRDALTKLGRWASVSELLLPANDASSAVRLVAMGEADAGVVYATDAAGSSGVRVLWVVPESAHEPIRYPFAVVRGSGERASGLAAYLSSSGAAAVFGEMGFEMAGAGDAVAASAGGAGLRGADGDAR